ncbi:MAG: NAD(P)/FAD-dependent oxidoreductase [Gemmobacter sp.]
MTLTFDAIVVGAGIAGTASAWFLQAEGLRVALIDTHGPGWGASGRNPGFLWLQTKATGLAMDLSLECRRFAEGFAAEEGDASFRPCGGLILFREDACLPVAQAFVADRMAAGLPVRLLDRYQVADMVPEIGPEVTGAVWNPLDAHQDSAGFVLHLAARFAQGGGTVIAPARVAALNLRGDRCLGVTLADGTRIDAAQTVLATGPFCNDLLGPLGLPLPFRPVRFEVAATTPAPFRLGPVIAGQALFRFFTPPGTDPATIPADPSAALAPHLGFTEQMASLPDGRILYGCAFALDDAGDRPSVAGQAIAGATLSRNLPALAALPVERAWAGSVAMTADSLPVIDAQAGPEGLVLNLGHWFGNLAGGWSGRQVADLVTGKTPSPLIAGLGRARLG